MVNNIIRFDIQINKKYHFTFTDNRMKKPKIVIEYSVYQRKKTNQKPFRNKSFNKDGSLTVYGVSSQGHRFTKRTKVIKTDKDIKSTFKEALNKKDGRKTNVTYKVIEYTGSYNKQKSKVNKGGKQLGVQFFNLDKKETRKRKGKTISYTNDVQKVFDELNSIDKKMKMSKQKEEEEELL